MGRWVHNTIAQYTVRFLSVHDCMCSVVALWVLPRLFWVAVHCKLLNIVRMYGIDHLKLLLSLQLASFSLKSERVCPDVRQRCREQR